MVEVRAEAGRIQITVRDDGAGFDAGAVTYGFGVIGMRERAELLGGKLTVDSSAGRGTTVRATLPAENVSEVPAAPPAPLHVSIQR